MTHNLHKSAYHCQGLPPLLPSSPSSYYDKKLLFIQIYTQPTARFLSLVKKILHLEKHNASRQRSLQRYQPQQIFLSGTSGHDKIQPFRTVY